MFSIIWIHADHDMKYYSTPCLSDAEGMKESATEHNDYLKTGSMKMLIVNRLIKE